MCDYVDPNTFNNLQVECAKWDMTYRREPNELHPNGIEDSHTFDIPTNPIPPQTYTKEEINDTTDRSDPK